MNTADDDAERLRAMRTKGEEWRYDQSSDGC
jgi:hypothetical protein